MFISHFFPEDESREQKIKNTEIEAKVIFGVNYNLSIHRILCSLFEGFNSS